MNNRDYQIVLKILAEMDIISSLVQGYSLEMFQNDERTKRAVCMTLINIGELVKNLTEEFRNEHSTIPWKSIAGLRDVTAHKYQTLKMGDVWVTVKQDIPSLRLYLADIIK